MGEYACGGPGHRRRTPLAELQVHFAVSEQAPYAARHTVPENAAAFFADVSYAGSEAAHQHVPADARLCSTTPGVPRRSRRLRRAVRALFTCSSRPKQRYKAFRIGWMRALTEHWIAYPEFIAGGLGPFEHLKLGMLETPGGEIRSMRILPLADAARVGSDVREVRD